LVFRLLSSHGVKKRFSDATEEELIAAAQAGDRAATEILLRRYGPNILRICRRLCVSPEDLEEVYQDTLMDQVRYLPRFRGESGLLTWAYTIARTQWNRRVRRKGTAWTRQFVDTEISSVADRLVDPGHDPDEVCASGQLRDALETAMEGLSEVDRRILLLRDLEGFSAPEVADLTGLTVPAVKTRLHRARTAVRGALGERLPALRGHASGDALMPSA
jgi:RNA polymerase sigma-70 factor (ECF subfamily)